MLVRTSKRVAEVCNSERPMMAMSVNLLEILVVHLRADEKLAVFAVIEKVEM